MKFRVHLFIFESSGSYTYYHPLNLNATCTEAKWDSTILMKAELMKLTYSRAVKQIRRAAGFTLVEIVIVITIMGIMAYGLASAFSGGDESKVTSLHARGTDLVKAVNLYKARTGCVPNRLDVLFQKSLAVAGNNYCGQATTINYGAENYISPMPVDSNNKLKLEGLGLSGATVTITQNYGGGNNYALKFESLPTDFARKLMTKCSGADYSTAAFPTTFDTSACAGQVDVPTAGMAEVNMLISKY